MEIAYIQILCFGPELRGGCLLRVFAERIFVTLVLLRWTWNPHCFNPALTTLFGLCIGHDSTPSPLVASLKTLMISRPLAAFYISVSHFREQKSTEQKREQINTQYAGSWQFCDRDLFGMVSSRDPFKGCWWPPTSWYSQAPALITWFTLSDCGLPSQNWQEVAMVHPRTFSWRMCLFRKPFFCKYEILRICHFFSNPVFSSQ